MICKNKDQLSKEVEVSVFTRNYYSEGSDYSKKISCLNQTDNVALKISTGDKIINAEFLFPKELLFKALDVVAFEIKLVDNYTDNFVMSLGADVGIIEAVG